MTAAMISEMNSRSPRVVGMRRISDALGFRIGDREPGHDRQSVIGKQREEDRGRQIVQAIHAMFSMTASPHTLPSAKPRAM